MSEKESLEKPTFFHSFKKHFLNVCHMQVLRSKDGKDPLTLSAPVEPGQRVQHPSKDVRAQGGCILALRCS